MRRPSGFCWAATVLGLVLLLPAGVFAQPTGAAQEAVPPGGIVHTVVPGDTLWDLSAKYMGSPWRWKEIWELNRFVTNPHYVYPGIRIVIVPSGPREAALLVEPPGIAEPVAAAMAPPPSAAGAAARDAYLDLPAVDMIRAGQFVAERPRGIGKIVGGKDPKVGFSTDDTVFLALDRQVPAGQLLAVYRVRGPLDVDGRHVRSGYVKYLVGVVQVGPVEDGRPTAKVRDSFIDLTREDLISEELPAYDRVKIDPGDEGVRSQVIATRFVNQEIATGDFVFLENGSSSGVKVGNVFRVYKPTDVQAGATISGKGDAKIDVARLVVVRADKDFSTAYVYRSIQSFETGVEARRGIPAR